MTPILFIFMTAPAEEVAAPVPALIQQLGHDEFRQRQAAQAALLTLGKAEPEAITLAAVPFLKQKELDVEIRARLKQVVRRVLLEEVYDRPRGYIGMYMALEEVLVDKKIVAGIKADSVVVGGPCAKAGMVVGDHVIGVDGVLFDRDVVSADFIKDIQSRRPGDRIKLKLLREARVFEVEMTLGTCPPNLIQSRPQIPFDQFYKDWWLKHIGR